MRSRSAFLLVTALTELGAGFGLLVAPSLVAWLLLDSGQPAAESLVTARICGGGLLALGVACWSARSDHGSPSQRGILQAAFLYDLAAAAILGHAGATLPSTGIALYPAVVLHAGLAVWCLSCLRQPVSRP